MYAATSVQHQCLFCQKVFDSASLKDDHILEHFAQETCVECNQNVIRIGSKLYTVHDAVTCINRDKTGDKAIKPVKPAKIDKPRKQAKSPKSTKPEDAEDVVVPCENKYKPEVEVSGYEEILIKVEEEDEEESQAQSEQQVEQIVEVDVEVEDENQSNSVGNQDPEYIIIDFNDIPLVRGQQPDQPQSIPQPSTKQITKCDVCGQEFDCLFFLESHRKLKHPTATTTTTNDNDTSTANVSEPVVQTPKKGTKSITKPNATRSKQIDQKLECLLCNKMYKTETSLRHHIDTIHDPSARKYRCDICGTGFFREAALQNHHENQHLDMKKFICGICNTGLKSKIALERHMFQHTGKNPFKCTWNGCKKTFTTTANRDEHMRSHTGEKRFQCTVEGCNNRYIFAADIRKHLYKIHNIFPKKFPCQSCAQVFPQRAMLMKHMKKHSKKR